MTSAEWIAAGFGIGALAAALLAGLAFARLSLAARADDDSEAAEDAQDRLWQASESEERYRALVEATTDVIVQRDAAGRITFANEGYATLFAAEAGELVGSRADLDVVERGAAVLRAGGTRRVEECVRTLGGDARWFQFVEMTVQGSTGLETLRAGCDVTDRIESARALEEARARAEAANVAKSRFLATVSHEFRTPLNGILGMTDLVLETQLDAEQRTYLDAVRTSGGALLTLVDGILDFSRIEAGKLELAVEPFDAAALAESVVELLAPRAQDKGIEIALDVAEDVRTTRLGDADRVRQILLNLAGNAVKFTQSGGVGVTLTRDGADSLVLTIEDTGPGIDEAQLPLLFEEFEQGEGASGTGQPGTGLGLAITRRLVEQMQGRIEVRSTPGRGSTFRVVLPLPPAAGAEPLPFPARLDGRRMLIVADSPFQAPYLARQLTRAGASAVIVPDADTARAALSGARFDALIADRCLGDTSLHGLSAEAARCGVRCSLVLLSPFDRRAFGAPNAAAFDSYLIKPVRARSLFDRLLEPRWVWHGAAEAAPLPEPTVAAQPGRPAQHRVLLAEDNPINALLASKALERLGAEVVIARDGPTAVAAFTERGPFDLALIDIRMPGFDGLETARRIRTSESQSGAPGLTLFALSANAGREDEQTARAAGFDGFLAKPLDLKRLPSLLQSGRCAA